MEAGFSNGDRPVVWPTNTRVPPDPVECERALHRRPVTRGVEHEGRQLAAVAVQESVLEVVVDEERVVARRGGERHPVGRDVGDDQQVHLRRAAWATARPIGPAPRTSTLSSGCG